MKQILQTHLGKALLCLLMVVLGGSNAWGAVVTYKLTITGDDFNTTSYAANNNEKTSTAVCTTDGSKTMSVKWTSYQVMKNGTNIQWQKNNGYIYNSTDLGTITNVTVTSSAGTFTTYYGDSKQPSSSTTVGGGFFQIKVGNATGTASKVEVTFQVSEIELTSIAISGTPSKTIYEVGETFDPTGLIVTGTYSDDSEKEITEGINWDFDGLKAGDTSLEVMATVGERSDIFTVTGLTVRTVTSIALSGTPTKTNYLVGETFSLDGVSVIASYNVGDTRDVTSEATIVFDDDPLTYGTSSVSVLASYAEKNADKDYDITVSKKESSISISDIILEKDDNATITPTKTPADATITYTILEGSSYISIEGNVITANDLGTAIVKASYAGSDEYLPSETTFTVNVTSYHSVSKNSFTSVSGSINTFISYTSEKGDGTSTPFLTSNCIRLYQAASGKKSGGFITLSTKYGVKIKSVTITTSNTYENTKVGYCVDNGVAPTSGENVAENSTYTIKGLNNESVSIYCLGTSSDTRLEIATISVKYLLPEYSRTTTVGNYGTICLPFATTAAPEGATFYTVGGTTENGVMLVEHGGALAAGTPYVFKATDSEISATYTGFAAEVQAATGLVGNLDADPLNVPDDCYVLSSNLLRKVNGGTATVAQYRAYFNLSRVDPYTGAGVKAVVLGWNEATGIDLPATEKAEKVIFDLSGRRVEKPAKGLYIVNGKKVLF